MTEFNKSSAFDELRKEYEGYKITVELLVALKYLLTEKMVNRYNKFYMGRNMGLCKPDFVAERGNFALVGEIKAGIPSEDSIFVKDVLRHVEKCDKINDGWEGQIGNMNTALFVLSKFASRVTNILNDATEDFKRFKFSFKLVDGTTENMEVSFARDFSLWSFARDDSEPPPYFNIEKRGGVMADVELQTLAKRNIIIPYTQIFQGLSELKFYDQEPPDIYLLDTLWTSVVGSISNREDYVRKNVGNKKVLLTKVSPDKLSEIANALFLTVLDDDRGRISIRRRMVVRFLNLLEKIDLAEKEKVDSKPTGDYIIKYRNIRNPKEFFTDKLVGIMEKEYKEKNQKKLNQFSSKKRSE